MNVRLQIKLPYFRACGLTSPYRESVVSFLLISFSSQYIPTAVHSTVIWGGGFPAPQFRTGIWYFWIFILFSSTVISYCLCTPYYFVYLLFILVMKLVLPLFFLGASLDIFGTIISRLNCSTRIPLTKEFFVFIIYALIF